MNQDFTVCDYLSQSFDNFDEIAQHDHYLLASIPAATLKIELLTTQSEFEYFNKNRFNFAECVFITQSFSEAFIHFKNESLDTCFFVSDIDTARSVFEFIKKDRAVISFEDETQKDIEE